MNINLRLGEEPPMPPEDADFSFTIDFKKGEGNPRRVFDAAGHLIEAFATLDSALASTFDETLEPVLVLEDVEAGSLRIWLRSVLTRVDDEALKTLDWKPLIGRYLVRAKYIVLEYCDSPDAARLSKFDQMKRVLQKLARETDIRQVPDYPPVNEGKLISSIEKIQRAKKDLSADDKLTIEADGRTYEVDLTQLATPSRMVDTAQRESASLGEMILTVRKPDLLKDSMWQFIHGKSPLSAPILDQAWLERFHNREVPIFPGDALRCRVRITYWYNQQNELEDCSTEILEVLERVPGQAPQQGLFPN